MRRLNQTGCQHRSRLRLSRMCHQGLKIASLVAMANAGVCQANVFTFATAAASGCEELAVGESGAGHPEVRQFSSDSEVEGVQASARNLSTVGTSPRCPMRRLRRRSGATRVGFKREKPGLAPDGSE